MENKTFLELINDRFVVIPEIQRDYAQGRKDKKIIEIRNNFLNALIEKLSETQDSNPMILDFIYGSDVQGQFIPLDGQQRLTTLFLLHWYLIPDGESHLLVNDDKGSKFTYQTRISSKDFCNELVKSRPSIIRAKIEAIKKEIQEEIEKLQPGDERKRLEGELASWTLSKGIVNQKWFAWKWRQDPTIKAMLVMLDAIDEKLAPMVVAPLWEKLSRRAVVFHLLYLSEFNLSDELYVKMNARGKELSSFDIFKSTLEEQMRINDVQQDIQNTWRKNFDSYWIDIFWNRLPKDSEVSMNIVETVETKFLRFLKRMMAFHLYSDDEIFDSNVFMDRQGEWKITELNRILPFEFKDGEDLADKIREYSVRNDVLDLMPFLCKTKFFSNDFFIFIITTLNNVVYEDENKNRREISNQIAGIWFEQSSQNLFDVFVDEKISYDARIQYYAVIQFAKYNCAETIIKDESIRREFNSWMRVIRNITTNTNTYFYNTWDDFNKSIKEVRRLASVIYGEKEYESILAMLANNDIISGFDTSQVEEESIKAQLMTKTEEKEEWSAAIRTAEEHKYLLGQIRFLLKWSESDIVKFKMYFQKFCYFFNEKGLKCEFAEQNLFRNMMLLTVPWYLKNNEKGQFSSFIENSAKDRDWSWKRYLRDINATNIKILMDSYTEEYPDDVHNWIEGFINSNKPSDWRKCFIEYPQIYDELYDHKVSWWYWDDEKSDGEICLLSKTRWSSRHKELRTYYWYFKYHGVGYYDSKSETTPFTAEFRRDETTISVKFYPKWDNKWVEGEYIIYNSAKEELRCRTSEYEQVEVFLSKHLVL